MAKKKVTKKSSKKVTKKKVEEQDFAPAQQMPTVKPKPKVPVDTTPVKKKEKGQIQFVKLADGTIKVKIEPGEGARVLQGMVTKYDEEVWMDLCVISPPGAPKIIVGRDKKLEEIRLTLDGKVLEKATL